jgi:hypothetical protein
MTLSILVTSKGLTVEALGDGDSVEGAALGVSASDGLGGLAGGRVLLDPLQADTSSATDANAISNRFTDPPPPHGPLPRIVVHVTARYKLAAPAECGEDARGPRPNRESRGFARTPIQGRIGTNEQFASPPRTFRRGKMRPLGPEQCSIEVCETLVYARLSRLCRMHFERKRRHGDPNIVLKRGRKPRPMSHEVGRRVSRGATVA